jgi:hypothetical protein
MCGLVARLAGYRAGVSWPALQSTRPMTARTSRPIMFLAKQIQTAPKGRFDEILEGIWGP